MVYNQVQYIQFNTYGNTARKIAQAPAARPVALPKARTAQKSKVICIDPVAVLSIAVAICMVLTMTIGIVRLSAAREQAAQMESYAEKLATENEVLKAEYQASYNIEQIEASALALGMIPREQAQTVSIRIAEPQEQIQQVTFWEHLGTMLTTLFA